MDKRILLMVGLIAAVLVAGCTEGISSEIGVDNDDNEENGVEGESPAGEDGITVLGPECTAEGQACEAAEITEFSVPELDLSVQNDGTVPAEISLDDLRDRGENVLVSMCDEYRVREFRAGISGRPGVGDIAGQPTVTLEPMERLDLTWFVEPAPDATIDDVMSCSFDFELVFEKDVQTMRQVQVRDDREVPVIHDLSYETSSNTPVALIIETDGDIVQDVIGDERAPIQVEGYAFNRGTGEVTEMEHPDTGAPVELYIPGMSGYQCSDRSGDDVVAVEDTIRVCSGVPPVVQHSQLFDIIAETRYTYETTPDPVELTVRPLEG